MGIIYDCMEDNNWSPINTFCKCLKKRTSVSSNVGKVKLETVDTSNHDEICNDGPIAVFGNKGENVCPTFGLN